MYWYAAAEYTEINQAELGVDANHGEKFVLIRSCCLSSLLGYYGKARTSLWHFLLQYLRVKIFTQNQKFVNDLIYLPSGTLDEHSKFEPDSVNHSDKKQNWVVIPDALP